MIRKRRAEVLVRQSWWESMAERDVVSKRIGCQISRDREWIREAGDKR